MLPKKRGTLVQCYKDGAKIGERTIQEWAAELGVKPQAIYDSKFKGTLVQGRYRFYAVDADPEEPSEPATLSEKNAEARAQGKSYGQLQAEETLAKLKEEKMENEMSIDVTPVTVKLEEVPQLTAVKQDICLQLCDFAEMVDETIIIVYDTDENWILTAPNTSAAFALAEWGVVGLRADIMDGKPILKVVVR